MSVKLSTPYRKYINYTYRYPNEPDKDIDLVSDRASEPVVSWALVRPIAPPADVQILRQEQYFRVGRR